MIFWDMYQESIRKNDSSDSYEEEIDISSDFQEEGPIIVEVTSDSHKLKTNVKRPHFPFPWTSEQIQQAFEKIDLEEKCEELENVVFYNSIQFKQAI